MASRDLLNQIHTVPLFPPVTPTPNVNTPIVSNIIDTAGFDACTFVIETGALTSAGVTVGVLVEDGDQPNLSDNAAVPAYNIVGSTTLASFGQIDSNKTRKIGYVGQKRYVRLTLTPANNGAGSIFLAGVAILGYAHSIPLPNPPQA